MQAETLTGILVAILSIASATVAAFASYRFKKSSADARIEAAQSLRHEADARVEALASVLRTPARPKDSATDANSTKVTWEDLVSAGKASISIESAKSSSRDIALYTKYAEDAIGRSRLAFILGSTFGAAAFIVILFGIFLSFTSSLQPAIVSAAASGVGTLMSTLFYRRSDAADKRADNWFEKSDENLRESDNLDRALEVVKLIEDPVARNKLITLAGIKQLFPSEKSTPLAKVIDLGDKVAP